MAQKLGMLPNSFYTRFDNGSNPALNSSPRIPSTICLQRSHVTLIVLIVDREKFLVDINVHTFRQCQDISSNSCLCDCLSKFPGSTSQNVPATPTTSMLVTKLRQAVPCRTRWSTIAPSRLRQQKFLLSRKISQGLSRLKLFFLILATHRAGKTKPQWPKQECQ